MTFETRAQVRFADVDPAGIVFYPRYFEMLNGAVEDWFADRLGLPFAIMHRERHMGVPTVSTAVTFLHPSILGEDLSIVLNPREIGKSSCKLDVLFTAAGQDRLKAEVVLVCMNLQSKRSMPWPDNVRGAMQIGMAA